MAGHPSILRALALFLALAGLLRPAAGQGYYDYGPAVKEAYTAILSLRLPEAEDRLRTLRQEQPDNLAILHLEDYIDFFTLYIGENNAEFDRRKPDRDARLRRLQEEGDPESPYFLFLRADIRLHWALVRLKFGEYLGAFTDVRRAYKLLRQNRARFPGFMPTYKDLGILHAMVGSIPEGYRWALQWLGGLDGTIDQGKEEMARVLAYARQHEFFFAEESTALYAYLLLHLDNAPESAWAVVSQAGFRPRENLLHCFVLANVAMRSNRNEEALALLEERPRGEAFMPFHYLDLLLGLARLRRLDPRAEEPLLAFATRFRGKNFIKEAYQKLAWNALVHGHPREYLRYLRGAEALGHTTVDGDKAALREAERAAPDRLPHPDLLRARLLFDGGYYQRAAEAIAGLHETDLPPGPERLELLYRRGRIAHGLGQYSRAIHHYQRTIALGAFAPEYYACNAALQAGLVYEALDAPELAAGFYRRALDMDPAEYRTGMHQRAKAGLARLRQLNP